jgi:hypothetical protein
LADACVADYFNDTFVSTYLKVGTFQIVNGQKQGGNVASYFCLDDGSVVHAVPGQVNADKLLSEARWAYETHKAALTFSTDLVTGEVDLAKLKAEVQRAHVERFYAELHPGRQLARRHLQALPAQMPLNRSQQAQTHWVLANQPLANIASVYPMVWTQILKEELSGLPVLK